MEQRLEAANEILNQWVSQSGAHRLWTYTTLFRFLNNFPKIDIGMQLRHSYYLHLTEQEHLVPDQRTFHQLIRGIRGSEPPRYKFISYFLKEMTRFNVDVNEHIIKEIMHLCAECPSPSNSLVAKSWFDWYRKQQPVGIPLRRYLKMNGILHSYLQCCVRSDDFDNADKLKRWSQKLFLWDHKLESCYDRTMRVHYGWFPHRTSWFYSARIYRGICIGCIMHELVLRDSHEAHVQTNLLSRTMDRCDPCYVAPRWPYSSAPLVLQSPVIVPVFFCVSQISTSSLSDHMIISNLPLFLWQTLSDFEEYQFV